MTQGFQAYWFAFSVGPGDFSDRFAMFGDDHGFTYGYQFSQSLLSALYDQLVGHISEESREQYISFQNSVYGWRFAGQI